MSTADITSAFEASVAAAVAAALSAVIAAAGYGKVHQGSASCFTPITKEERMADVRPVSQRTWREKGKSVRLFPV